MLLLRFALLIPLAVSPVAPPPPPMEVLPVTIADLIRFSEAVVVARVVRVETIHRRQQEVESGSEFLREIGADVPFAELAISRIVKGSSDLKRVIVLAGRTWTCDATTAVAGETALFFLGDEADGARFDANVKRRVRAEFPEGTWMYVMWDGYGRMPLRTTAKGERVEWPMHVVEWPQDAPSAGYPRPDGSEFDRSVPLVWLEEKVRACREEQGRPWFTASVSQISGNGLPWELEVALDGNARLVIHDPTGDRERRFRIALNRLPWISRNLRYAERLRLPKKLGTGAPVEGVRTLRVVAPEPKVDIQILSIDDDWMASNERRHATIAILDVWGQIRESLEEPECADHRGTDARWRRSNR